MESNPFPVVRTEDTVFPWNLHRVNLSRMPPLDVTALNDPAQMWFHRNINSQLSHRESKMLEQGRLEGLTHVKCTILTMMMMSSGMQRDSRNVRSKVFALMDKTTGTVDTVFFVNELRFDLVCHTVICDAFILSLSAQIRPIVDPWYQEVVKEKIIAFPLGRDEIRTWKQLLPALAERCRATWRHTANCEYAVQNTIPLGLDTPSADPLCSCGRGEDVDGMYRIATWKNLAPFVTRIALSPLFAVPYLETLHDRERMQREVQNLWASGALGASGEFGAAADLYLSHWLGPRCAECSEPGDDLRKCSRCKAVSYCSEECQKAHWKKHKPACVART